MAFSRAGISQESFTARLEVVPSRLVIPFPFRAQVPHDVREDRRQTRTKNIYCVNSAGLPVSFSIRLAIGGCVENRFPKFIPKKG